MKLTTSLGVATLAAVFGLSPVYASETGPNLQELQRQLDALTAEVERLSAKSSEPSKLYVGGYGELHYNNYKDSSSKLDLHRFVLMFDYAFSNTVKLISEFEIEHALAGNGDSKPGEVEMEQAYIDWALADDKNLAMGVFLVPVGILNDNHEPTQFYGVERNNVEKYIVPTTWWEGGVMFSQRFESGWSYDIAVTSGLDSNLTPTGNAGDVAKAEAQLIRKGRQKVAEAVANDGAATGRVKYTGIAGLEWAATVQYQENISQGQLTGDDKPSAVLAETHVVYNTGPITLTALYAQWQIDGDEVKTFGGDKQEGAYVQAAYLVTDKLGVFGRVDQWDTQAGWTTDKKEAEVVATSENKFQDYQQYTVGVNYWLDEGVVLKADVQEQEAEVAGGSENNGFNLGIGWNF